MFQPKRNPDEMKRSEMTQALANYFSKEDAYFVKQPTARSIEVLLPYRNVTVEEIRGSLPKEVQDCLSIYPVEQTAVQIRDMLTNEMTSFRYVHIGVNL